MQQRLYDKARLEFAKTVRRSSPSSKWFSSAQARLLEIKSIQPFLYYQTNSPKTSEAAKSVAYNPTNIPKQANLPNPNMLQSPQQSSVRFCPKCGVLMEIKVVTTEGAYKGKSFYVCPNYKQCQQVFPVQ